MGPRIVWMRIEVIAVRFACQQGFRPYRCLLKSLRKLNPGSLGWGVEIMRFYPARRSGTNVRYFDFCPQNYQKVELLLSGLHYAILNENHYQ